MAAKIDNNRFRELLLAYPAKAIELLYETYYNGLTRLALRFTRDEITAEDIVQEVFLYVWKNHKRLGQYHEQSIEHYLTRAVRYKAISHYKQKIKLSIELLEFRNNSTSSWRVNSAESGMMEREIINEIRLVIATFPKRERECLLMKMDKEMTPDQIAEVQKVTRKAVERSLTSAYKRLRKYLKSR